MNKFNELYESMINESNGFNKDMDKIGKDRKDSRNKRERDFGVYDDAYKALGEIMKKFDKEKLSKPYALLARTRKELSKMAIQAKK